MRFSFVILHYLVPDVTRRCLNCLIENFGGRDISVVVVDNASPDGSGAKLKEEYSGEPRISFLLLDRNEGFAKGNNAGYRYAVDNFKPDFIIVMNNDVMVEDSGFVDGIAREYGRKPFAVLGPDIYSPAANWHQNPVRLKPMNLHEAKTLRAKMIAKYKFFAYNHFSWNLKLRLELAKQKSPVDPGSDTGHEGCVLHGACYIFSPDFIKARPMAFNPDTFLYVEEDILAYECAKASLPLRYTPELKVVHLEDAATNAAEHSDYKRKKAKYGRICDSLGILIKLMEGGAR